MEGIPKFLEFFILYRQDLVLGWSFFNVFNGKKKRTSYAKQELNQYWDNPRLASCLTEGVNLKGEFMLWKEQV